MAEISEGKNAIIVSVKRHLNRLFLSALRSNTHRVLQSKMERFQNQKLFDHEDLSKHFAHIEINEQGLQNTVKGFIIDRISFIEECLRSEEIAQDLFIDIGDPDGIFIKALGKKGISANISKIAVDNVHAKGFETIRCDAEHLPLKNNAVDHILFFEIFEHLQNPISALNELERVARKSVFLSIPHMSTTNIHRANYIPDCPAFEHHIFEFGDEDFRKIVTHTGFTVGNSKIVEVIGNGNLKEKCVFLLWNLIKILRKDPEYKHNEKDLYFGCFRKFTVYHLVKPNVGRKK